MLLENFFFIANVKMCKKYNKRVFGGKT